MHSEEAKIYTALLIAAGILGLILIFFIITIVRQQKKHQQLHKGKINAEIITLEKERKRIARDLHDDVAMILSVARLELSGINETFAENKTLLSRASGHIDDGLSKIREIAHDLMPVTLIRKGLLPALDEFFNAISQAHEIQVDYFLPGITIDIPENNQTHLYRVVQEIFHNTLKHSRASKISFGFSQEQKCIRIFVSDNGIGFNQEKVIKENTGFGLHNILSRIEMLDGVLYLDTAEGKGVSYTIEIPSIKPI